LDHESQDFQRLLLMYTGAIAAGIPVFVLKDFFRERLSLRWREWMTGRFVNRYFENRNFYRIQVCLASGLCALTSPGQDGPRNRSIGAPVDAEILCGVGGGLDAL
jgi:ABC-type uncharacterized transport system fused permease/ATPase subunit